MKESVLVEICMGRHEICVGRLLLSHPSLSQTKEAIPWPRSLPLAYTLVMVPILGGSTGACLLDTGGSWGSRPKLYEQKQRAFQTLSPPELVSLLPSISLLEPSC